MGLKQGAGRKGIGPRILFGPGLRPIPELHLHRIMCPEHFPPSASPDRLLQLFQPIRQPTRPDEIRTVLCLVRELAHPLPFARVDLTLQIGSNHFHLRLKTHAKLRHHTLYPY